VCVVTCCSILTDQNDTFVCAISLLVAFSSHIILIHMGCMYLKAREKKIKHIHVEQNLLLRYNRLHDSEIYQANASRDGMDGVGVDVGTYR
jgi:hypothetical protein